MSERSQVLVAIMNDPLDLDIARSQHWYRIPVPSVQRFLQECWPPEWLGFYQTQVFGDEAYAINYYARVLDIRKALRRELFPNDTQDEKADHQYYQLLLSPLERLPKPIPSLRLRRIVFIPTTRFKLAYATEINDLYNSSPLEEQLWAEFKLHGIGAERQEFVKIKQQLYELDFTIYCANGRLNVETDGDRWHSDPERIPQDNRRDNELETAGWSLLRFNTRQIREEMEAYCLPTITKNIERLGGLAKEFNAPSAVDLSIPADWYQLILFKSESDNRTTKNKKKRKRQSRPG